MRDVDYAAMDAHLKKVMAVKDVLHPMEILFMENVPLQNVVKRRNWYIVVNAKDFHANFL